MLYYGITPIKQKITSMNDTELELPRATLSVKVDVRYAIDLIQEREGLKNAQEVLLYLFTQYEPSALAFGRQKAVLERQISEQFKQATQRSEDK